MVRIEVLDAEGNRCWRVGGTAAFAVDGGELLATDNGNLMEATPYSASALPLWHGAASCVILRRSDACTIRVQVNIDDRHLNGELTL